MTDRDPHPDSLPEHDHDERTDIEQIVEPRAVDVERGDGEPEPDATSAGLPDGVGGTSVQDDDAQLGAFRLNRTCEVGPQAIRVSVTCATSMPPPRNPPSQYIR